MVELDPYGHSREACEGGGVHPIQRDSCRRPRPKTFSTPGAGQTSLEPKRMCDLLALPT